MESDVDEGEVADVVLHDVDLSEPTMGEKLAGLSLPDENKFRIDNKEKDSSVPTKPPSADSVHVLLRQALNADDRALLLDCLYTQDEKVLVLLAYVYVRMTSSFVLFRVFLYDMRDN